jgi:hypothetical protein
METRTTSASSFFARLQQRLSTVIPSAVTWWRRRTYYLSLEARLLCFCCACRLLIVADLHVTMFRASRGVYGILWRVRDPHFAPGLTQMGYSSDKQPVAALLHESPRAACDYKVHLHTPSAAPCLRLSSYRHTLDQAANAWDG